MHTTHLRCCSFPAHTHVNTYIWIYYVCQYHMWAYTLNSSAHFLHILMSIWLYGFTMFVIIISRHIHSKVLLIFRTHSCQYVYMELQHMYISYVVHTHLAMLLISRTYLHQYPNMTLICEQRSAYMIYVWICIYTDMCTTAIFTFIRTCRFVYSCEHVRVHIYTHVFKYVHIFSYMYKCIYMKICEYTYIYTRARERTTDQMYCCIYN